MEKTHENPISNGKLWTTRATLYDLGFTWIHHAELNFGQFCLPGALLRAFWTLKRTLCASTGERCPTTPHLNPSTTQTQKRFTKQRGTKTWKKMIGSCSRKTFPTMAPNTWKAKQPCFVKRSSTPGQSTSTKNSQRKVRWMCQAPKMSVDFSSPLDLVHLKKDADPGFALDGAFPWSACHGAYFMENAIRLWELQVPLLLQETSKRLWSYRAI